MAEFNGNAIYLRMSGVNVETLWQAVEISQTVDVVEVTAGSGTVYKENAAGLVAAKMTLTLAYNDTQAATDIAAQYAAARTMAVVYGPEGNTSGKPCDNRTWVVDSIEGPSAAVGKPAVILKFGLTGTGVPTKDIFKGETF